MSKGKPVLGRGLDALLGKVDINEASPSENRTNQTSEKNGSEVFLKIPVEKVSPNPFQPRSNFEPKPLEELRDSILKNGLIQPITVRRIDNGSYQLISGERRLKVFKEIGYREIPAYIIEVDSNEMMLAMALIENLQREKLNPIEEAYAYKRLMEECSLTQEMIATRVGKDRTTIANVIRLLKLPPEVREALIRDEISMGHARALINLESVSAQLQILKKIKSSNLSVRNVERLVKEYISHDNVKKKRIKQIGAANSDPQLVEIEDKLRRLLGTKVQCKIGVNGRGEIVIEFYSQDEFERLLELLNAIDNTAH